jgi:hypothetical protein
MTGEARPGRLARLDARLVPSLAGAARGTGRGLHRLLGVTGPPGRWVARTSRDNPIVVTAVAAVAVTAVLLVTTGGDDHHAVAPAPANPAVALPGGQLGPTAGQPVSTYLAAAQQRRSELSVSKAPKATAVVDFTGYLTARAAVSELAGRQGLQVDAAFVRVAPPQSGPIHSVTLAPGADLSTALTRVAANSHRVVVNYRKAVARAKSDPTAANVQVVTDYAQIAREARTDSVGISASQGCVFAMEITGPPAQLLALARRPGVRVVDPAPPTVSVADLMIVPLEPQTLGVVPPLEFADY